MSVKLEYGFNPKMDLQSFNSKNGLPRIFPVKRTQKDFDQLIARINNMVLKIQAGDFSK